MNRLAVAGVPGGPAGDDAVVLVTSDRRAASCPAFHDMQRLVSARGGVRTLILATDTRAHATLAAGVSGLRGRVVFVPIAFSAGDAVLADAAGLLRSAKARWPEMVMLQADPLAAPEHVAGWVIRQTRDVVSRSGSVTVAPEQTAVALVGPESASTAVNAEVCAIARIVQERNDYGLVAPTFPTDRASRDALYDRLRGARERGVRHVAIVPCGLLRGLDPDALDVLGAAVSDLRRELRVVVAGPLLTPGSAAALVLQRYRDAVTRWLASGVDGLADGHGHVHDRRVHSEADALLPPRYRHGRRASPLPMRSAALRYDDEGRVAWNEMWQSYCDLALAGGPPHRGTLLEPALREEVHGDPEAYARVVAEITRALSLVTRLPVVADAAPGWVGLVCPDEEMAIWLLRAITVENVSVRREGAMLLLPAGPRYRIEKEIKNVVTAVAKTHHYWTEHRAAR